MKKFLTGLIIGIIMATALSVSASSNSVTIFVNDTEINSDKAYISDEGITMIPLRAVVETLGLTVNWDGTTKTIYISSPEQPKETRQPLTLEEVTKLILPAVVKLESGGMPIGTGFFVSSDGKVITNVHVIEGYNNITAVLQDGKRLKADLLKVKKDWDLCLLKVSGSNYPYIGNFNYEYDTFDTCYYFPYGLDYPVAKGQVRAFIDQPINEKFKFIYYSGPITRGSSGGPVINEYGELIGVNYRAYGYTAVFAIASEYVAKMLE